jgi:hypothetical protein
MNLSNRSPENIIAHAEWVVSRVDAERQAWDMVAIMDKEERAVTFRERWRYAGVMLGTLILILGMATTPDSKIVNVFWWAGAGLAMLAGVIIGHLVYRKRTPW